MHAMDKKLLRDFRRLWAQALAIALVLACGVAILLTSYGMYNSLEATRTAYYERSRFADIFATTRRAPLSLLPEIESIPGVWAVEARTSGTAILDIKGRTKAAVGRILSLPVSGTSRLNIPVLRSGHLPDPDSTDQIVVNEPFAIANGFQPGATLDANLNGTMRTLTIVGTVLSPEFIYTIGPGALMPDNEGFGILWLSERAAAAAFGMVGAFNNVSLKLTADARPDAVIDRLDAILDSYGGLGAYDRTSQESNAFIDAEIMQLRNMTYVLPPVFFGVAAFLVNMVIGRIVALERSEIGLMKALGYSDIEICIHYLFLAALIAAVGIILGWAVGAWLSQQLARLYAEFFNFPFLLLPVSYAAFALSGIVGLLTAALGAGRAALSAARLPPAVAMQPPAPPHFRRTLLDRGLSILRLSQSTIMIFRSFVRWPVRSFLTTLGLSLAVAVLVASSFFDDALAKIMDSAFYQANRQDAILLFSNDLKETTIEDVRHLPGVLNVEGQQFHAAILHNGHLSKRIAVEARRPDPDLSRVLDADGHVLNAPEHGILLTDRLAEQLNLTTGDMVTVEFLSPFRETHQIVVSGMVTQYFGLGAYMDLASLNAIFRQAPRISMANVMLDDTKIDDLHAVIKTTPKLTGAVMLNETRRSFEDTIQENVVIMTTVYITIAVLITVGVAYNGARIQLSERARELASLRILGFTKSEVSFILVGETMVLALLAQPLGWAIGSGIAALMTSGFTSDLYAIPLVLKPATFTRASLIVLAATLAAVLVVRRRLDRLNLVTVMKTRE